MTSANKIYSLALTGVQQLVPYKPGKPIEELERELGLTNIVKLASNENPLGPGKKSAGGNSSSLTKLSIVSRRQRLCFKAGVG